jgi:uncharacterized protein involved in exopolysaccharide biosynthesis
MQSMTLSQQINRNAQEKLMLESELENAHRDQTYYQNNLETVIPGSTISVKNEKLIDLNKRITEMRSSLAGALNIYGEQYPDINQMKAQIASLEKQKAELEADISQQPAATSTAPRRVVNPAVEKEFQDIRNRIASIQTKISLRQSEIDELTKQRAGVEKEMTVYQRRIDEAPIGEQQYAALMNDFNLAKQSYQEAVRRHEVSQTAQSLEEHKAGETLDQLDPPSLPEQPIEPDRWAWAGIGTLAGLVCGLGLAAFKEVKDTSLKNLKDVRAYTNLPVLSSIPLLENALLLRRKRRLVWLAWSSGIIVGCVLMAGSMYYYISGGI